MTEPMSAERLADSRAYFEYSKATGEVARRALEVMAENDRLRFELRKAEDALALAQPEHPDEDDDHHHYYFFDAGCRSCRMVCPVCWHRVPWRVCRNCGWVREDDDELGGSERS